MIDILELEHEADHIRADVQGIADEFDIDFIVVETGTDQPDITVMEGSHLVAEMAQVDKTMGFAFLELLERGGAVNAGGGDPFAEQFSGEFRGAIHFNGEGNFADRKDGIQALDFFNIRLTDEIRVLGAEALRVDEGTFQMDAGDLTAFHAGLDIIGSSLQCSCQRIFGERQGGGQEGGHPFFQFIDCHGGDGVIRCVAEIFTASAVAVDIHKTGHDHIAFHIHDGICCGKRIAGSKDTFDFFAFDQDRCVVQIHIRRDEMTIFEEKCCHDDTSFA